jgi:hypothetical protein
MSDKELLEDAAKAAGLPVEFSDGDVGGYWPCGRDEFGDVDQWWNPLTDDGDALRLAVKLGLDVRVFATRMEPYTGVSGQGAYVEEGHWDDHYAATRRAIVRAAASIRRAGKES